MIEITPETRENTESFVRGLVTIEAANLLEVKNPGQLVARFECRAYGALLDSSAYLARQILAALKLKIADQAAVEDLQHQYAREDKSFIHRAHYEGIMNDIVAARLGRKSTHFALSDFNAIVHGQPRLGGPYSL